MSISSLVQIFCCITTGAELMWSQSACQVPSHYNTDSFHQNVAVRVRYRVFLCELKNPEWSVGQLMCCVCKIVLFWVILQQDLIIWSLHHTVAAKSFWKIIMCRIFIGFSHSWSLLNLCKSGYIIALCFDKLCKKQSSLLYCISYSVSIPTTVNDTVWCFI